MKKGLLIDILDNVAVVTTDIREGERIKVEENIIIAKQSIPVGHKIAIKNIDKNQHIYKYGVPIGLTKANISKGEYIHTHNIIDITEELCKKYVSDFTKEVAIIE